MTSISLIAPYAPQPAVSPLSDLSLATPLAVTPSTQLEQNTSDGSATDQSGAGAGNGTGTGGALTTELLRRNREGAVSDATLESVVEAQSKADATADFLERQKAEQAQARAEEAARVDAAAEARQEQRRAVEVAAEEAARFEMPNPIPTAPILQTQDE